MYRSLGLDLEGCAKLLHVIRRAAQPTCVGLRYGRNGRQDLSMPFAAKEPFFVNLLRVLGNPSMDAEVHFLDVVEPAPDARRRMAEQSRARIVDTLGYGDP